jgi:hypothetical protein
MELLMLNRFKKFEQLHLTTSNCRLLYVYFRDLKSKTYYRALNYAPDKNKIANIIQKRFQVINEPNKIIA